MTEGDSSSVSTQVFSDVPVHCSPVQVALFWLVQSVDLSFLPPPPLSVETIIYIRQFARNNMLLKSVFIYQSVSHLQCVYQ